LLIAVALATSRLGGRTSLFDLIADLTYQFFAARQARQYCFGNSWVKARGRKPGKESRQLGWTGNAC